MADYATLKGRATPKAATSVRRDPPALRDTEAARVEANRQFVRDHMPELIPTIRALYEAGLIDGWRSVNNCRTIKGGQ